MNKNKETVMRRLCRGGYTEGLWLCRRALNGTSPTVLMTPNAEMIAKAVGSDRLTGILKNGDILFPDGIGIFWAMKRSGMPAAERSCGIELCQRLLKNISARKIPVRVFLLGGAAGVAEKASKNLTLRFNGLNICGTHSGYFNASGAENDLLIKEINESRADLLLVCMGFPRQEKWMLDNRRHLSSVKLMMGLGGSLDVWSGNVPRAPMAVRELGFEWAYRAVKEPSRIARLPYLATFAVDIAFSRPDKHK